MFVSDLRKKMTGLEVKKIFFVFFLILIFSSLNEAKGICEERLELSLEECINLALEKNLDIRIESLDPRIQEMEIAKEKAEFDPRFILETKDSKSETETTSWLSGGGGRDRKLSWEDWYSWFRRVLYGQGSVDDIFGLLGYRKGGVLEQESLDFSSKLITKFITGGVGELKFTTNRLRTNSFYEYYDETYRSYLTFSLTQPLLKNFGINLNKSRIRIASNNWDISKDQLRGKVISIVSQVQEAYWNLWRSIEEHKVRQYSLELAQNLLSLNEALVKGGRLPPVAILQAKSGVASRREGVLLAENAVENAQDYLRKMIDFDLMDESYKEEKPIFPKDEPDFIDKRFDVAESYKIALLNRPDFNQAKIALNNQKLALKLAKNQLLPKLDIGGSYTSSGIDPHYSETLDELSTRDNYYWEAGIVFEVPLGNRLAKSAYSQEKMKTKKAEMEIEDIKKKILLEVREIVRGIETNVERIEATHVARILAEEKLKAEEERFRLGRAITIDLLRFQEDLASAKISEDRALVDYRKLLSKWEMATAQSPINIDTVTH